MGVRRTGVASGVNPIMREIFLRLDAGHLHDQALAAVTGYSSTAIRNWRNGRRQPPMSDRPRRIRAAAKEDER
jgi:hypothetical protein